MPVPTPTTAGFFVRIDESHVADLIEFMRVRGEPFDTTTDLIPYNSELYLDAIFSGANGPELVERINACGDCPPRLTIVKPFAEMTHSERWALLMFATLHNGWTADHNRLTLDYLNVAELVQLQQRMPQLFPPR